MWAPQVGAEFTRVSRGTLERGARPPGWQPARDSVAPPCAESGQETWVVLEYLLMGHHLIPGVSGMSGMLCKLLGRGEPPGAPAGRVLRLTGTEPCSVLLPATLLCGLRQKHCSLPQKTHPWATDRVGRMFKGWRRWVAASSDALQVMNVLFGLSPLGLDPVQEGTAGARHPVRFAGREAGARPADAASPKLPRELEAAVSQAHAALLGNRKQGRSWRKGRGGC